MPLRTQDAHHTRLKVVGQHVRAHFSAMLPMSESEVGGAHPVLERPKTRVPLVRLRTVMASVLHSTVPACELQHIFMLPGGECGVCDWWCVRSFEGSLAQAALLHTPAHHRPLRSTVLKAVNGTPRLLGQPVFIPFPIDIQSQISYRSTSVFISVRDVSGLAIMFSMPASRRFGFQVPR